MKTKQIKRGFSGLAAAIAMTFAGTATAGIPVFDGANFIVNGIQSLQLAVIAGQLDSGGDINIHTNNIDMSTKNIDLSTKNIDKSTYNIDITTTDILNYTELNYDITLRDFQVIIGGGGGVVPIPDIAGNFADVTDYQGRIANDDVIKNADMEGSLARKEANDQLVKTMIEQQGSLQHDMDQMNELMSNATKAQGHGNQLQYANAIAGERAHQMLQIRSLMLAQNNADSAASQAEADREAREIASAQSLRRKTVGPGKGAGMDLSSL